MASINPPLSAIRVASAGEHVELEVLTHLAASLPEHYELFHHVDWTYAEPHRDNHGELDIAVVNRAGDIAVLEVKAGELDTRGGGLIKRYGQQRKDVAQQATWQFNSILRRLKNEALDVRLLHCLVLPHHRISEEGTVNYPRERIADAEDCKDLAGFVQRRLGAGRPDAKLERVRAFLLDRVNVQPDVSALAGTLARHVSTISGGLARWVPRMEVASGVVHVRATAGSGKTQLALTLLRQAYVARRQASYVCFNRPLADQMRTFVPGGVEVSSFHQLCWEHAGRPGSDLDFDDAARRYLEAQALAAPTLDILVIDELQDMRPEWVQALVTRVRAQGRIYLLEDPEQCVYADREQIEIDQATVITARENYRSPRTVVETINLLQLINEPVAACSPHEGTPPVFTAYGAASKRDAAQATAEAVRRCRQAGFPLADIVVLCWRGRHRSELLGEARLAEWTLSKFTGAYDDRGHPIRTEGELTIDTVRRFKGQSALAVVLTEVDFDEADTQWPKLLFVGLTRARMHVEVVLSEAAERLLSNVCPTRECECPQV
jgi:hypothetical protein